MTLPQRTLSSTAQEHLDDHNVLHPRYNDVLSPVDSRFGAVGDGVADDTAALQACIDVVARDQTGTPGATIWLGPHTYRITNTLLIRRQAIRLLGDGVGNATDYTANPGRSTMIKWDGIAGIPMIKVNDSHWNEFSNFILKGHDTNTPSEGIFFDWATGENAGTNAHQLVDRVHFGHWIWGLPTSSGQMNYGIRFGGENGNNDEFLIERSLFRDCLIAGIAIDQTQSTWGHIFKCMFNECAIGVKTFATTQLWYPTFNLSSDVDIEVNSSADVIVFGYGSEHAALGFRNNHVDGRLHVFGGRILCQMEMTGGRWAQLDNVSGSMVFHGFVVDTQIAKPVMYVRGSAGSPSGLLAVKDCPGLSAFSDFDVQAAASGPGLYVDIDSYAVHLQELLTASAVMSPAIPDVTGSAGGNVALQNLLTELAGMGLITDSST